MSRSTKYDKRITIQQSLPSSQTKGDTGGLTDNWTTLFSCWADVTAASRSKKLMYGEIIYNEFYEVEMRKRSENINADCRIVFNNNNYQVLNITITDVVEVDMIR